MGPGETEKTQKQWGNSAPLSSFFRSPYSAVPFFSGFIAGQMKQRRFLAKPSGAPSESGLVGWLLLFLHLQILSLSLPFKSVGLRTNFLHFCYYFSFRHPAAAIHKVADYEEEEGGRTDVFSLPPPLRAATTAPSFLPSFTHFWQFMVGGRGWSYSPSQSAPLVGGLEEMGARFMHSGKTIGRCFGSGAKCTCIHFLLLRPRSPSAFTTSMHWHWGSS